MKEYETYQPKPLTPHSIEVLLWCHTRAEAHPDIDLGGWRQTIGEFVKLGALEKELDSDRYRTTPLGSAWVNSLCNTCIPRQVFVDQNNNIL